MNGDPRRFLTDWEPWFAWHPVRVNGRVRWLRKVYRRAVSGLDYPWEYPRWHYGTAFDVIRTTG